MPKPAQPRPYSIRPFHGCYQDNVAGGKNDRGAILQTRATAGAGYGYFTNDAHTHRNAVTDFSLGRKPQGRGE
ncbi:MAG: hypothetical protein WCJ56_07865 [bacterium]